MASDDSDNSISDVGEQPSNEQPSSAQPVNNNDAGSNLNPSNLVTPVDVDLSNEVIKGSEPDRPHEIL